MRRPAPLILLLGVATLLMAAASDDQAHRPQITVPQNTPTPPGLRGPESPTRATPLARVTITQVRSHPLPAIAAPPAIDPLQCRAACAQPYYFCLAGEEEGPCPDEWRRCVTACDQPSEPNGSIASPTGAVAAR
jgi:hypothetical protein